MRAWTGLAVAVALATTSSARAQSAPPASKAATLLFDEGRDAAKHGDFLTACARFERSDALDPKIGTVLNLADCQEHLGHFARALELWAEGAKRAEAQTDERLTFARSRLASLEARTPKLTLRPPPARVEGLEVARDGIAVDEASFGKAVAVDPGPHVLETIAPSRAPWRTTIKLAEGESREVQVEAGSLAAPASPVRGEEPAAVASVPSVPPHGSDGTGQRRAALAAAAVGAAGVVIGSIYGGLAMSRLHASNADNHCDASNACDADGLRLRADARSAGTVSTVAFVVGAAGLGTGAVLYFTAPAATVAMGPRTIQVTARW